MGLSIFFTLNPCFLVNSELITNPIIPLSNNASTVISFCIFILSSLIFTVISLNMFPLSKLQQDILSVALINIVNLLQLLRSNQGLLNFHPCLNYCYIVYYFLYISVFFLSQFYLLFSCSYNSWLSVQISHSYSSSYSYNLPLQHMDCVVPILPTDLGIPLLCSFFLLLSSEQVLLASIFKSHSSSAKLEAIATVIFVFLDCFVLEPELSFFLSIFPHSSYFPSNFYLDLLFSYVITQ